MFALKTKQIDALVVDLPTAFYVTAVQVPNGKILGQLPAKPGGEHFGMVFQKGNPLAACVNAALATAEGERHAEADPGDLAVQGRRRPRPEVAPVDEAQARRGSPRASSSPLVSTVVVFTALGFAIVNAPGWDEVKATFFNWREFRVDLSGDLDAFWLNVKIFCIAEVLILPLALLLAMVRSLPGPVFFPLRVLAIVYTDFFRGVPTILVITLLGFGVPALRLAGVPTSTTFWGIVALVLVYTAYVSEVYRAGIESVHPSQAAAARSLGLSHLQALWHVVVPQAVRRVIPPLLNDFIGLQKDTALVGVLGAIEAFKQTQIDQAATFNFTSAIVAALLFIAITIPLARFTDWLIARDRRRQLPGRRHERALVARERPQVVRQGRGAARDRPRRSPSTRSSA